MKRFIHFLKARRKLLLVGLITAGVASGFMLHNRQQEPVTEPASIPAAEQVISGNYGVPSTITVPSDKQSVAVVSAPVQANFAFNAIAPHWKEVPDASGNEENRHFRIRTSGDNKNWSEWYEVEVGGPLRDDDPSKDRVFPETPIFAMGLYYQFEVVIKRPPEVAKATEISDITVSYLDSRQEGVPQKGAAKTLSKLTNGFFPKAAAAGQGPEVISRAGWGSPDPYGESLKNTEYYWPATHAPVKQMFLHHTVNSNTSSDFSAVVRGIWHFHTYTRGWGDIGYNYLIDSNGKIYEGRHGGDNVVGGHTYGFNRGSMAVALIGCYVPNDSTCTSLNNGNSGPSDALLDSLYNILGRKAKDYEIDLLGSHEFCGTPDGVTDCRNLYKVATHRDAGSTSCPGEYVYNLLPTIRSSADSRKSNLFPYSAKQLTYGPIVANTGQTSITLQFKNTGTATWSNTSPRFFLKTANPNDRTSSVQGDGWITYQHPALLYENSVPPGSTGTFTFNVNSDGKPPGTFYEGFRLVAEGVTDLNGYFSVPIIMPTYKWSQLSLAYSSGTARMAPGSTQTITLTARNTGTATWNNTGANPVRVGTWPPDRASPLQSPGWLSSSRMTTLQEASVAPGENGTFVFQVTAPQKEGEYGERFNLVAENRIWANDIGAQAYFHVVNPYKWNIQNVIYEKGTGLMDPGSVQLITVIAQNTGSTTWSKTTGPAIRLGTWLPQRESAVMQGWNSPIRAAEMNESIVMPGQTAGFQFYVKMPATGQFYERFNLVAEGQSWFNDVGLTLYLFGNDNYAWSIQGVHYSSGTGVMIPNSTQTITVKTLNTGQTTWQKSGTFPVRLGTWPPQRQSPVANNWLGATRMAELAENTVAPGQVGTFTADVRMPATGLYYERMNLVAEGLKWFNDPGLTFYLEGRN